MANVIEVHESHDMMGSDSLQHCSKCGVGVMDVNSSWILKDPCLYALAKIHSTHDMRADSLPAGSATWCRVCGLADHISNAKALRAECEGPSLSLPGEQDDVNHPSHYTAYKGIEVIQLTEQMNFNRGNAVKYIARAGLKDPSQEVKDLEKAAWYINREIERLKSNG